MSAQISEAPVQHDQETCQNCNGTGKVTVSILRTLRKAANLKQGAVAKKIGLSQSAYSRMEDRPLFYSRHANALADLFKVSIDQLYGRVPIGPKPARPVRTPPDIDARRAAAGKKRRDANKKQRGRK